MLDKDLTHIEVEQSPELHLLNAILANNSELVIKLLEAGADPNYLEKSPLYLALENYILGNEDSIKILNSLLKFGADFLDNEYIHDDSEYENIFHCAVQNEIEFQVIAILISHAHKLQKLSCINLTFLNINYEKKLLKLFAEYEIIAGASAALESALIDGPIYCIKKERSAYYKNLSILYQISENNGEIENLHPQALHKFVRIAIEEEDYSFAYSLITNHQADIHYQLPDMEGNDYTPILFVLLSSTHSDLNIYHSALLALLLNKNYAAFYTKLKETTHLYHEKHGSPLIYNPILVKHAKSLDTTLYSAVITFLNPLQQTLNEKFDLKVRLKLAIAYLHNEMQTPFALLPDQTLEKLLLHRVIHYFYFYHPQAVSLLITHQILKKLPSDKAQFYGQILRKNLHSFISKYRHPFLSPKNRQILVQKLSSINYQIFNNTKDVEIALLNVLALWSKNASINKIPQNDFMLYAEYTFVYSVEELNEDLLFLALKSNKFKDITNNYTNISNVFTYIKSNDYLFNEYIRLTTENKNWIKEKLIKFCISLNSAEAVKSVLKIVSPTIGQLEDAAKINNAKIFDLIISRCNIPSLSDFLKVLELSFSNQNTAIISNIFHKLNHSIKNLFYASDQLNEFFIRVLNLIFSLKKYLLIDPLLILADNIGATSLKMFIVTILQQRLAPDDFWRHAREYLFSLARQNLIQLPASIPAKTVIRDIAFDSKTATWISRLLQIKSIHNGVSQFISKHNKALTFKKTNFLNNLSQRNYLNLVNNLRYPTMLPRDSYEKIMSEKGISPLNFLPNILCTREKIVYSELMKIEWFLTHRVKNPNDLTQILQQGEIRSVLLRRQNNEFINQRSPAEFQLEGFIFLTIGPKKSPTPNFLQDASGIEIAVQKLLKILPNFFSFAHLSSHWFSFKQDQVYPPTHFMGSSFSTKHTSFLQHSVYQSQDGPSREMTVLKKLSDDFYTGKRLIHILILLFIEKLRLIGGKLYEKVLEYPGDHELLSNLFSQIMHPGLLEVRYPYSIPLNNHFYSIISPLKHKVLSEEEMDSALDDIPFLEQCIKDGFDPDQKNLVSLKIDQTTVSYSGSFLTRAITASKLEVVDFLLESGNNTFWVEHPSVLSPLDAAILMNDTSTFIKLLTKGIRITNIPDSYRLAPDSKLLPSFLEKLSNKDLSLIATHSHKDILTHILLIATRRLSNNIHDQTDLIKIIYLLLERGADPNSATYDHRVESPLKYALHALCAEAIIALLKSNADFRGEIVIDSVHYGFFEYVLYRQRLDLVMPIINLIGKKGLQDLDLLILFLSGNEESFRTAVLLQYTTLATQNIHELLYAIVTNLYHNDNDILIQFLYDFAFSKSQWINKDYLHTALRIILDPSSFFNYILEFGDILFIKLFLATNNKPDSLLDMTKFILENNFINQPLLILALFNAELKNSDPETLKSLFSYLQKFPEFYIAAIRYTQSPNILDYLDIKYILVNLFKPTLNHFFNNDLLLLLSEFSVVHQIIDFLETELITAHIFIEWLLCIVNDHTALSKFLTEKSLQLITPYLKKYKQHFLSTDMDTPCNSDEIERLRIFIYQLCPEFGLPKLRHASVLWAKRIPFKLPSDIYALEIPKIEVGISDYYRYMFLNIDTMHNKNLPSRFSVVAFITSQIKGETHVYLGRKILMGNKLPHLLAPGGYYNENGKLELMLEGLQREIEEETKFSIGIPQIIQAQNELILKQGEISLSETLEYSSNYPEKISFLFKYHMFDNFNLKNEDRERSISFLWLNYKNDLSQSLSSGDDFADGMWIPISKINCDAKGNFFFNGLPILRSNGLMINMINNKHASRTLIQEVIFRETFERDALTKRIQSQSFFKPNENGTIKRLASQPPSDYNSSTKNQKIFN